VSNTVTIYGNDLELDDEGLLLLDAAVARAVRGMSKDGSRAEVFCASRRSPEQLSPGWLEFALVIKYAGGGGITISCIQRKPGVEFEFHS